MDTIIIRISHPYKFKVHDNSIFLPEITPRQYKELSGTERRSQRHYLRRSHLVNKLKDYYTPSIEIFETLNTEKKTVSYVMKIEFSAPKLLYSNSLQEVSEKDYNVVLDALEMALKRLRIEITRDALENARVTAIHTCKNIPLPRSIHMRDIIEELSKMEVNKAFEISDKQVKRGSRVLNLHSGTIDWSFYDKISDCMRPKNKRTDKTPMDKERLVVEQYHLQTKEVFRYEYRIKKTQTVRREINLLLGREYQKPVILKDLFRAGILKKLVLGSWTKLKELPQNQLSLFTTTTNKLDLFLHIRNNIKERGWTAHSESKTFTCYALADLIKHHGAKEIKSILQTSDHPERLKKKIKEAAEIVSDLPYSNNIGFIDKALNKFELIDLATLEKGI